MTIRAKQTSPKRSYKCNTVWISRTVLLETEWVLRTCYKLPRERIHHFFQYLLQAENASIEEHASVEHCLERYRLGADFADTLHLAACWTMTMHTFDRGFCKAARNAGITPRIQILDLYKQS